MNYSSQIKYKLLLSVIFCCVPAALSAEESSPRINTKLGFFTTGSVVDLSQPLEYSAQQEMEMGPTKGFDLADDFKVNKPTDGSKTNPEAEKPEEKAPPGVDPHEFALKKEFGDPSKPVPIKGVDNAPAPYKAMLKAMELGRDDLALQYAEQWMGYLKSLDGLKMKTLAMSQVIATKPDQVSELSPETLAQIDSSGLQKYLEKRQKQEFSNQADTIELQAESMEKINALFGEGQEEEQAASLLKPDPSAQIMNLALSTEARRSLIRQHLAHKLPLDPSGKIKILFFFKPSDPVSALIGQEMTKTLSDEEMKFPVSIVPLSVEPIGTGTSTNFINATGLPAVVRDGVHLSQTLKISKTPAVVFVTSATDKSFVQTGPVDAVFLKEVINMIGGK